MHIYINSSHYICCIGTLNLIPGLSNFGYFLGIPDIGANWGGSQSGGPIRIFAIIHLREGPATSSGHNLQEIWWVFVCFIGRDQINQYQAYKQICKQGNMRCSKKYIHQGPPQHWTQQKQLDTWGANHPATVVCTSLAGATWLASIGIQSTNSPC